MKILFGTVCILVSSLLNSQSVNMHTFKDGVFKFETGTVHYLDFGGEGMPIVFLPSNDRDAESFKDFAPRFSDEFQVYALSFPGSGKSEGNPHLAFANFDLKVKVVIAFLNHLKIERAVIIDRWYHVPVYLAERHPDRVVGVVMMNSSPPDPYSLHLEEILARDYTKILEMAERWNQTQVEGLPDLIFDPDYVKTGKKIKVPFLLLRHKDNTPFWDRDYKGMLDLAQWAVKAPEEFPDDISRNYFQTLAADTLLQNQVNNFYKTTIQKFYEKTAKAFFEALEGNLEIYLLEGEEDYGYYHYIRAPDMIENPIRDFLRKLKKIEKQ